MDAILLMTSVTPVAEEHLKQHSLQSLSPAAGQQLLQRIAPSISPGLMNEVVRLCLGMPLLIRLIADALLTKRLTIQVKLSLL